MNLVNSGQILPHVSVEEPEVPRIFSRNRPEVVKPVMAEPTWKSADAISTVPDNAPGLLEAFSLGQADQGSQAR